MWFSFHDTLSALRAIRVSIRRVVNVRLDLGCTILHPHIGCVEEEGEHVLQFGTSSISTARSNHPLIREM